MARYNIFGALVTCPYCLQASELSFQADIGNLQWQPFRFGDDLQLSTINAKPDVFGPDVEAWKSGRDLWATGLAVCPNCKRDVFAKIVMRSGKFDSLELVEPQAELYAWGYI